MPPVEQIVMFFGSGRLAFPARVGYIGDHNRSSSKVSATVRTRLFHTKPDFCTSLTDGPIMTPTNPELEQFRANLLTLQSELLAASSSGQDAAKPVELDQTTIGRVSRMDALQDQAMAQASQQRRHIQLQRIESALQRLESGEFGWCMKCGEEIARKRLEVDPTAPLCITCADAKPR